MTDRPILDLALFLEPLLRPLEERLAEVERRQAEGGPGRKTIVGYLPEEEAAIELGIGRTTLRNIRRRGEIAFAKHCGRVLYRIDDLKEYLDARRILPRKRRRLNSRPAD